MKVLCIGESTYDIYVAVDGYPLENSVNKYQERIEHGGGAMNNIAFMLGKWAEESYLATVVGTDDYGTKIKKELETAGARIDFIETSYEKSTNIAMTLHNKTNGSNTVYNLNNNITLKKFSFSVSPNILVVDGTDYAASLASLERYKDAKKIMFMNNITKENLDLSKYCDYIIMSKEVSESLVNQRIDYNSSMSIVNVYNLVKQRFTRAEIIINISNFGVVYSSEKEIKITPTLTTVNRVDLSGELESFTGAFIYCLGNGYELEKAICYGTIAGAFATGNLTARGALPAKEEVINYYNTKFDLLTAGSTSNPQVAQPQPEQKISEMPEEWTP